MHTQSGRASVVLCLGLCVALAGCGLVQPATPNPSPVPGAQPEPPATGQPPALGSYTGRALPLTIAYPKGWLADEAAGRLVLAAGPDVLAGAELEGPALVVSRVEAVTAPEEMLSQASLEGLEIIRRGDATLGGEAGRLVEAAVCSPVSGRGYQLLLVTATHEGQGYLVTASAPLEQWEAVQTDLQRMIESIAFR